MPRIPLGRWGLAPLAICLILATAAVTGAATNRWEPVPPDLLAGRQAQVEPDADAEYVFRQVWVSDELTQSFYQVREHYDRVKILTQKGADEFTRMNVDYALRGTTVDDIRARVIQPDGSTVELDKKAVITETVIRKKGKGLKRKSFALPGVRPGCVVEYRWHQVIQDASSHYQRFDFQGDYPAQRVVYHYKPLQMANWYVRQTTFHCAPRTGEVNRDGFMDIEVERQPAFRAEPDSPPEDQQRAWMMIYYTNEALKPVDAFWTDLGTAQAEWFQSATRPDGPSRDLARSIAKAAADDEGRVRALMAWMQRDFRVVSNDRDSMKAAGLKEVADGRQALRQRGGTHTDAILAFGTLARSLDLHIRYLRVPSRSDLFFDRNMMHPMFIASYQVAVRLGDHWTFLDPSTRYLEWDMLLWNEEAQMALLCDRDSTRFVETPIAPPERSCRMRTGRLTLAEDGTLEGDIVARYTGHLNQRMRQLLDGVEGGEVDSTIVRESPWLRGVIEVSKLEVVRGADRRQPLEIRAHVRMPQHAAVTGKRLLLEPAAFDAHRPTRFSAGTRRAPVYFEYPWSESDSLRIDLPTGWKVEAADTLQPIAAQGVARYEAYTAIGDDGRHLTLERTFAVGYEGSIFFPVSAYPGVKQLFDLVNQRDRAVVTLIREGSGP